MTIPNLFLFWKIVDINRHHSLFHYMSGAIHSHTSHSCPNTIKGLLDAAGVRTEHLRMGGVYWGVSVGALGDHITSRPTGEHDEGGNSLGYLHPTKAMALLRRLDDQQRSISKIERGQDGYNEDQRKWRILKGTIFIEVQCCHINLTFIVIPFNIIKL